MINELAKMAHENAKSKGFFDDERNIGEMLCLIHSEVSEALEADRKGNYCKSLAFLPKKEDLGGNSVRTIDQHWKTSFEMKVKDTFEDELADIMIRVMNLAEFKGIDLESHIKAKMRYNSLRERKHGKKY